jgi:hypothetical protein
MIEQAVDIYSYYHMIGGFGLGLFLGLFLPRRYAITLCIVLPIFWEVVEANILASWAGVVEPESILNSLTDIVLTVYSALLGSLVFFASNKAERRRKRRRRR